MHERHRLALALAAALAACSGSGGAGAPDGGAPGAPDAGAAPATGLALQDVVTGLGDATDVAFLPDGRMLVTEKGGAFKIASPGGVATLAGTFDVDDESEKGLLGVAVDPAFATTRRVFLYLSAREANDDDRNRVLSVRLRADGTVDPDPRTQQIIVRGLHGPANHDGGALAIGPDGKLYIGVGDSGFNPGTPPEPPREPTNHFASCLSNANGKILRVELDGSPPADNPLAGVALATACGGAPGDPLSASVRAPPRREIWAWGFRNPWRFWFDPRTGNLWVGDVGEVTYEEIDIARAGKHHGWPWREGPHGWPTSKCAEVVPESGACVDPLYHCRHGDAADGIDGDCQSITGGLIVDAPSWPAAERGRYVFSDNVNGRIWSVAVDEARSAIVPGTRREIARVPDGAPVSLREGPGGEPYVVILPGRVAKLAGVTQPATGARP
jgi:glucose/arabinose dehydrogenase